MATDRIDANCDEKVLFVFDFDKTLVKENSDIWVLHCIPSLKLEEQMNELRRRFECWTDMMDYMLKVLHENGCSRDQLIEWMKRMKPFAPMESFLKKSRNYPNVDVAIVSDSNTVFIDSLLEAIGCSDTVKEVHSNPAKFSDSGRLVVTRYHSHTCRRCRHSLNMCKGTIVANILTSTQYHRVVYIGDGGNDVCPCLALTSKDTVIARKGYSLAKNLQSKSAELKAHLHVLDFESQETEAVLNSLLPVTRHN